jgi:hypothetical protein
MIVAGRAVDAAKANELGIADELAEGPLLRHAIAFARSVVSRRTPLRPVSQRDDRGGFAPIARPTGRRSSSRRTAPARRPLASSSTRIVQLPFAQGLSRTRSSTSCWGDQSRALRYVFRAERRSHRPECPPRRARTDPQGRRHRRRHDGSGIVCFPNAGIPWFNGSSGRSASTRRRATMRPRSSAAACPRKQPKALRDHAGSPTTTTSPTPTS